MSPLLLDILQLSRLLILVLAVLSPSTATSKVTTSNAEVCDEIDVRCATTVTSQFSPDGKLWRLWTQNNHLHFQTSENNGINYSPAIRVNIAPERISSRGENRPKIAFDQKQGVYLSWVMPLEKRFTSKIRFSFSTNNGQHFSPAQTVNDDDWITGHSFNEMLVNDEGNISIAWLDGRAAMDAKQQELPYRGSALFLAQSDMTSNHITFPNEKIVDGSCVCCRIALAFNKQDQLVTMWRHIYKNNIRDFALMNINKKRQPLKVSDDQWSIDGCPHQGGGLSIANNNRYHMTWFNNGSKGKGIFYRYTDNQGKSFSKPIIIADITAQPAHPHILATENIVDIVWLEFDRAQNNPRHYLKHQRSINAGKDFSPPETLSSSVESVDRPFLIKNKKHHFVSWHIPKHQHKIIPLPLAQ